MGFILIFLGLMIIGIVVSSILYCRYNRKGFRGGTASGITGLLIWIFSFIGFIVFCFTIPFVVEYCWKSFDMQKAIVERGKLERLLNEDYNSDNLKEALTFNVCQKESKIYNAFWVTYCWDNCYVVDTIPIPNKKFVPSAKYNLDITSESKEKK